MKRLFYRPLDDLEDLGQLEAKVAKTRNRFRRFSRLALALAAFFLFMQLTTAGPGEEAPGLVLTLVLAAATALFAVRALRTRPRALAAQRLLLQHRGLLVDEGRPAAVIGEDTGAILERIRARIAPEDLESICGNCPWLPLGVCRAGLEQLRVPSDPTG